MFKNVHVFAISGIPGVGKSVIIERLKASTTFQDALGQDVVICFVKEPSDLWHERGWLAQFYANPKKCAFAFQNIVYDTHVDAVRETINETRERVGDDVPIICITERCMFDQLLFWKVQPAEPIEDDAYCGLWNKWKMLIPPVDKIFFFQTTDIATVMERVKTRARPEEEKGLNLAYQTLLLNKHREWYTTPLTSVPGSDPVECVHINLDAPISDASAFEAIALRMAAEIQATISN